LFLPSENNDILIRCERLEKEATYLRNVLLVAVQTFTSFPTNPEARSRAFNTQLALLPGPAPLNTILGLN
jgi:hypothetical protein